MKVRIDIDDTTTEEEIIIKCSHVNETINNISLSVITIVEPFDNSIMLQNVYFNFFVYGAIGTIVTGIGVVILIMNQKNIFERTAVSSTKITKRNLDLVFATIVFSLAIWGITVIVGIFVIGNREITDAIKMFIINSFILTLVSASLGFLISQFAKNMIILSAFTTVIGLVLSFISGVFVPQALLGELTTSIAEFTPTHWFVLNNDLILNMNNFNLEPLMNGFLIQIGFALAFISIALVVSKHRMAKK